MNIFFFYAIFIFFSGIIEEIIICFQFYKGLLMENYS